MPATEQGSQAPDSGSSSTGGTDHDPQAAFNTETTTPDLEAVTVASPPPLQQPPAPAPRTHPLIASVGNFGTAPQDFGIPFDAATNLRLEKQRCEGYIMTLQQLMQLWERDEREGRMRRLANELELIVEKINGLPLRDADE